MSKPIARTCDSKLLDFLGFVLMRLSNEQPFALIAYLTANDYELIFFFLTSTGCFKQNAPFPCFKNMVLFCIDGCTIRDGDQLWAMAVHVYQPAHCLNRSHKSMKLNSSCYKTSM